MRNEDLPAELLEKMIGPTPNNEFNSNGCTMCPDIILGADARPACHIHDYEYHLGGGTEERKRADRNFYYNLRELDIGKTIARLYYLGCRLHGIRRFNWWHGRKKDNRFVTFFTRFVSW